MVALQELPTVQEITKTHEDVIVKALISYDYGKNEIKI